MEPKYNNSSPAFEEHTKILLAPKKGTKGQKKEEDKSNSKSQTYRIPSVLAYSLELNLILQIKGPAAKLAFKKIKEVSLE